ncbi:hypothetical protein QBC46DRAFT_381465 [Diplogelasinospora grovesii]|uniref:Zonadhesin n=1 Tax=Diplogelasinospora grovesii TaxID=303347 RepID=A0AAN6N9Q7_9PEZI|nr:hypothetical protein QBC46DRAFT_381465 [Diplogelasinospora grovesii]
MQQPLIYGQQPKTERTAYEYTIQATEDHEELHEDNGRGKGKQVAGRRPVGKVPNYQPTPLRWPFIVVQIVMLCIAIALIAYAQKAMPSSDSDAVILGGSPSSAARARHIPRALAYRNESSTSIALSSTSSSSATASETQSGTSSLDGEKVTKLVDDPSSTSSASSLSQPSSGPLSSGSSTTSSRSQTGSTSSLSSETSAPSSTQTSHTNSVTTSSTSSKVPPSISTATSGTTHSTSVSLAPSGSTSVGGSKDTTGLTFQGVVTPSLSSSSTNSLSKPTSSGSSSTTTNTLTTPTASNVVAIKTSVSSFTSSVTVPESTTTYTTVSTTVVSFTYTSKSTSLVTFTATSTTLVPSTEPFTLSVSGTAATTGGSVVTQTSLYTTAVTSAVTITEAFTSSVTEVFSTTVASTIAETVIPSVGSVTITYYSTIEQPPQTQIQQPPQSVAPPVKVTTGVNVIQGETIAVAQTEAPVTMVVAVTNGVVQTQVYTPPVQTGVTQIRGTAVTSYLVITPSPATQQGVSVGVVSTVGGTPVTVVNNQGPTTYQTMVDGTMRTVVDTPPPQTQVSIVGGVLTTVGTFLTPSGVGQPVSYTVVNTVDGTPVTQVVVTTPVGPPYQPVSYTVVNTVDGTPVTQVVVTTPSTNQPFSYTVVNTIDGTPVTQVVVTTPASLQPVSYTVTTNVGGTATVVTVTGSPTSYVTTINGKPTTVVTTPPVTSYTTTIGGTLTTETLVTTPTANDPITITFVSTSGGTLSTYTSTFSPTTFVSTVSGTLTTITSTPSPSTKYSTRSATTSTFTSTLSSSGSSISGTATSTSSPRPTVIATTRVFSWTEADIFLGTFLPALFGVAIVIPLRIIDLNAKLYQPFQSLARDGGSSGSESMLMQYTGVMAFITPIITMLQGHPVPFLTTLMVGCASLLVPLATEAIGLKLHGYCYLNTASSQCGPALGVSPIPANILIALMVFIIVMLALVMLLVRRWATGVCTNPWNLAGIASLARNPEIQIRQNSERAMRMAVCQKQYGLGYWLNRDTGREEYGIVLTDDAGRGLHHAQEEYDDGGDGEKTLGPKTSTSGRDLPFMALRYPWRIAFILFQLGILIFVVYYHVYYHGKIPDNGKLWSFMNSNAFGVRFVFAIVGVCIAFCWQSFFLSVSVMAPYQIMAKRTQPPERSILFTPSTNPFSGIITAVKKRHVFFGVVCAVAILSEFLPILLSNVPFSLTQTSNTATACAVLTAICLSLMITVLGISFFIRWPPMPVDPRSIAGALYYVSQSHMLDDFEGVALLDKKERDQRVREVQKRYYYGVLASAGGAGGAGGNGWRRLGVDCETHTQDQLVNVDTAYRGNRSDEPPAIHD